MRIVRHAGTMVVAAALLAGACLGGGNAGDGGGGGANAGGGGATSGGRGGAAGGGTCTQTSCGTMQFCDVTPNTCAGGSGHCVQGPLDCIVFEKKVCACDGNVYRSECDANGNGLDISDVGGCTPPAGTFSCGAFFCTHGTEYCLQTETLGMPVFSSQCLPLPSACVATPTCACVSTCCSSFTISTSGDLTTTCASL